MKTKTAYNHLVRLKNRMDSIHSSARSYCSPHADILARMTAEVWEDPALAKCPAWVRTVLGEHSSMLLHEIHRHYVLWAFMCPDGKPRVWEQLDEQTRASYCSADKSGAHYWLRSKVTGGRWFDVQEQTATAVYEITDKPF